MTIMLKWEIVDVYFRNDGNFTNPNICIFVYLLSDFAPFFDITQF